MLLPEFTRVAEAISLLVPSRLQAPITLPNSRYAYDNQEQKRLAIQVSPELPGGSPFSLCPASSSTDLFAISDAILDTQPLYFDDVFQLYLSGTLQAPFHPNTTQLAITIDCGSHCEIYGVPEGQGSSFELDFCEVSQLEQPLGPGKGNNQTCETTQPEAGYALFQTTGYVMPMFLNAPGWYNFTVDAVTGRGERLYCITTEVCLRWEDERKNEGYPEGPWSDCRWPR